MKVWNNLLTLSIIGLFTLPSIWANNTFPFRIQYFTTEEGLPQNTVDCIFRDSRGYMWFATWNGLCRFDGYNYRVFKSDQAQKEGLPGNFVRSISEDQAGQLWIGTDHGLAVYNLNTERFLPQSFLPQALKHQSINVVQSDKKGRIWVGSAQKGLYLIQKTQVTAAGIKYQAKYLGLKGITVNALAFNDKQHTWIGTAKGVWTFNFNSKQLQRAPEFPAAIDVLALCNDGKGNFWVGTLGGLFRYNERSTQTLFYQHHPDVPNSLLHNTVTSICTDFQGNLLVGTLGGLNQYLPDQNAFQRLSGNGQNQTQLNNEFISALLCDDFGNVWIGTEKGGVNKYNLFQKQFSAFTHNGAPHTRLSQPTVNSVLVEDEQMWIGTAGGGLNHWDAQQQRMSAYRHNPHQSNSLSGDFVSNLLRDRHGNLWVATWGQGLNLYNPQHGQGFQRFRAQGGRKGTLSNNFIAYLLEDPRGFLMIATVGGIDILDIHTKQAKKLDLRGPDGKALAAVGCLLRDHSANYWVGTRNGLYRFAAKDLDPRSGKVKVGAVQTFPVNSSAEGIPGAYVTTLREDSQGRIWLGTYGHGIAVGRHTEEGFRFTHYDQDQGLCNNVIYCIEEDRQGRMWLSTDNGLARFDEKRGSFRNFYACDGLLHNQFYWSASFRDARGRLYFGGINGLNFFDPDQIKDYPYTPRVSISDFKLFNNSVKAGEKRHGRTVLQQESRGLQSAQLSYKDNVFAIEFTCLDYIMPEATQYAYKLENVNQDWVKVPASRPFAQYNNLPGGTYLFKVKAANSDGNWSKIPTEFTLIIHPPFWETWWFRILGVMFLLAAVFAYIRWRTHYLRQQKKKLEQLVHLRTQKIEGQKTELEYKNLEISAQRDQLFALHQQVEEASQSRLRFFTNISHEFRTPLTLIIDPIENLLEKYQQDRQSCHSLDVIQRNAQRLLQLINQLMDFRRLEAGKVGAKVSQGDLVHFVKGVYESFQNLAEHQQIQYQFHYNYPQCAIYFDAEKLENILYNLLSNAFKYTPSGGKIDLELYFEPDAAHYSLRVRDTGAGIAPVHQAHIFEHFYQVNSPQNSSIAGSGIGLALTRELVEVLHGTIAVESKLGQGTEFWVQIPGTRAAFSEQEFFDPGQDPKGRFNLNTHIELLQEEMTRLEASPANTNPNATEKHKPLVLIAEDNYDLRAFLSQSLCEEYRILEASNGKEAFEMAKKYAPHLIISDIMMPLMDGLELCSRIKNNLHTCHIPVILLTAKAMLENHLQGLETGADDYIPKPFNLRILRAKMHNLIESRRKLKRIFSQDLSAETPSLSQNPLDEKFMERVYAVLDTHYSNAEFSVDDFATAMHVSRSLLYKKLKGLTDLSATDFINLYKLKKAIALLETGAANVSEVAFQVGFNDPKYFSRLFRRQFGMTPSEHLRATLPVGFDSNG